MVHKRIAKCGGGGGGRKLKKETGQGMGGWREHLISIKTR